MSPDPDQPRAGQTGWRLDALESDMRTVKESVRTLPVLEERVKTLTERLEAIQRVLWTIAGGLVLLVVSVLFAAASIGGG